MKSSVYRIKNLVKTRQAPASSFRIVVDDFAIDTGDQIAVVGRSGCGKSTLLDLLAICLAPDSAEGFTFTPVRGEQFDLVAMWRSDDESRLAALRRRHLGYVLQTGGLLPYLSVRGNLQLPLRLSAQRDTEPPAWLTERLGLAHLMDRLPGELSVGERQRVAVGRALVHGPTVVLADEPTASVDAANADAVMKLLIDLTRAGGGTLIVASHDEERISSFGLRRLAHRHLTGKGTAMIVSEFGV